MKQLLKKVWLPTAIFLIFLVVAFLSDDILARFGEEAISQSRAVLKKIVQIGLWLSAAYFVVRMVNVVLWDGLVTRALGTKMPRLLKDVVGTVIFAIAVTGIVAFVFEQPVTGIWATSSAIGIVLGFALRNIILDVFIGLATNIDQPYKLGDWVLVHGRTPDPVDGVIGCINEINWRTTRLKTTDGSMVILPNSIMGTKTITNFMQPASRSRFDLVFCLDYSVPTERALRVLNAGVMAACRKGGVLEDPPPKARVDGVSDIGVNYKMRYWIVPADISPAKARHEVTSSVLKHLHYAGMTLAIPRQDVFHAPMPVRHLDTLSTDDRAKLLAGVSLFERLADDDRSSLAAGMNQMLIRGGETLMEQGDLGESMYILVEGLLHVYIDLKKDGSEVKVANIEPGSFLGEMSLLTGEPRSATLKAATPCLLYEITRDAVNELLTQRPEMAETLSRAVAEHRLRDEQARSRMSAEEKEEQTASAARQIMDKMKSFFKGVFAAT